MFLFVCVHVVCLFSWRNRAQLKAGAKYEAKGEGSENMIHTQTPPSSSFNLSEPDRWTSYTCQLQTGMQNEYAVEFITSSNTQIRSTWNLWLHNYGVCVCVLPSPPTKPEHCIKKRVKQPLCFEHQHGSLRWLNSEQNHLTVSDLAGEYRVERPRASPRHAALVTTITHEKQTDCIRLHPYIYPSFHNQSLHSFLLSTQLCT